MVMAAVQGYGASEHARHDWGSNKRAVLAFSRARAGDALDQFAAVSDLGALSAAPIVCEDRKVVPPTHSPKQMRSRACIDIHMPSFFSDGWFFCVCTRDAGNIDCNTRLP